MAAASELVERVRAAVNPERLLKTAFALMEVYSPTCSAGPAADRLEEVLKADGFDVERPEAGAPQSRAVACRWSTGKPGRTLQFNGHLDTVHLPFVPPRVENGVLYGTGASDMKGGIAASIEAMRVVRDLGLLSGGGLLLTAHDFHEAPWGDGRQVDRLIEAGYYGDAVLLPEYLCDRLPIVGRGLAVLTVEITRTGQPVHEVMGGIEQPNVIFAGADLVRRMQALDQRLLSTADPAAGRASCFVGKVASGEIYNQSPTRFELSGTRRWLPGTNPAEVEREFRSMLSDVASASGTRVDGVFQLIRDAFRLPETHPILDAFQSATIAITGKPLPTGPKPFVDDGNTFCAQARIPAITHGPNATGAHTVNEQVPVDELVRVAQVYALTAAGFCG